MQSPDHGQSECAPAVQDLGHSGARSNGWESGARLPSVASGSSVGVRGIQRVNLGRPLSRPLRIDKNQIVSAWYGRTPHACRRSGRCDPVAKLMRASCTVAPDIEHDRCPQESWPTHSGLCPLDRAHAVVWRKRLRGTGLNAWCVLTDRIGHATGASGLPSGSGAVGGSCRLLGLPDRRW